MHHPLLLLWISWNKKFHTIIMVKGKEFWAYSILETKCLVVQKTIFMIIQNIFRGLSLKTTLSLLLTPSMTRRMPTGIINLVLNNIILSYCSKGIKIKCCSRVINWDADAMEKYLQINHCFSLISKFILSFLYLIR